MPGGALFPLFSGVSRVGRRKGKGGEGVGQLGRDIDFLKQGDREMR